MCCTLNIPAINLKGTMKTYKFAFIITITFFSCNYNKPAEKETENAKSANFQIDTTAIIPKVELPITPRFLSLIQHIDSLGYFDTSDNMRNHDKIIEVDKYILVEINKESTNPFFSKAENDREEDMYVGLLKNFDLTPLKKAQKVMFYYFKKIEPDIINGTRWYPDGIIEEWTFKNEPDAEKATKELIDSPLGLIYFNTSAFVCQKENNMYIFYSRASALMYDPQKKFFNWFVAQNNIELYWSF